MSKCYRISVMSLEDVDKALEVMFGFGFVFMRAERWSNMEQIRRWFSDMERGEWAWIIHGYDNECQMVFGTSRAFDYSILRYTITTLDEFIEDKCCCPHAWAELKKDTDISVLRENDEGEPVELFKYTTWWC